MSRREGGRRRLLGPELVPPLVFGPAAVDEFAEDAGGSAGAPAREDGGRVEEGDGVTGRDFTLALERSIQGFSGGILGTVYWATAVSDRSHRFGAQTPTRTRQAATRRLALQIRRG